MLGMTWLSFIRFTSHHISRTRIRLHHPPPPCPPTRASRAAGGRRSQHWSSSPAPPRCGGFLGRKPLHAEQSGVLRSDCAGMASTYASAWRFGRGSLSLIRAAQPTTELTPTAPCRHHGSRRTIAVSQCSISRPDLPQCYAADATLAADTKRCCILCVASMLLRTETDMPDGTGSRFARSARPIWRSRRNS